MSVRGWPFVVIDSDGKPANVLSIAEKLQVDVISGGGGGGPLIVLQPPTVVVVSVFAPLISPTQLATTYQSLIFAGINSGSQDITLTMDVGTIDGTHLELGNRQTVIIPAGGANSSQFDGVYRPWWVVSAQSADASAQSLEWAWYGVPR